MPARLTEKDFANLIRQMPGASEEEIFAKARELEGYGPRDQGTENDRRLYLVDEALPLTGDVAGSVAIDQPLALVPEGLVGPSGAEQEPYAAVTPPTITSAPIAPVSGMPGTEVPEEPSMDAVYVALKKQGKNGTGLTRELFKQQAAELLRQARAKKPA